MSRPILRSLCERSKNAKNHFSEVRGFLEPFPAVLDSAPRFDADRLSSERTSFRSAQASRAMMKASSTVSACVMSAESRGEVTSYPPSSVGQRNNTSSPSLTV